MKKIISFLCVATIAIGTTSCGLLDNVSINFSNDSGGLKEVFSEIDDSKNTYTGYSLIVDNISSENDNKVVGDININSDDMYDEVSVETTADNVEVVIDKDKKTINIKGNADFEEDEVNITVKGNISKLKFIDTMLEADININTATDVNINTNGNLSGELNVNAQNVFIEVNGAGAFDLEGSAKLTNIILNGAGKIDGSDLTTENSVVEVNGAGICEVNVSNELEATINGVGEIKYSGNPVTVDKSVNGLGRVTESR